MTYEIVDLASGEVLEAVHGASNAYHALHYWEVQGFMVTLRDGVSR